uniref:Uncharacterized protein n=1 Tax=Amphimedon queenslandica TaxID=400682 RepID=A0A1X7TRT9_AMPQE
MHLYFIVNLNFIFFLSDISSIYRTRYFYETIYYNSIKYLSQVYTSMVIPPIHDKMHKGRQLLLLKWKNQIALVWIFLLLGFHLLIHMSAKIAVDT